MAPLEESQLRPKQIAAIPHLIGAHTVEEGCKKAGINKTTFYGWLKEPAFYQELEHLRNAVLKDALDHLKGAAGQAVNTLLILLKSNQETIRERTAGRILYYLLKVKEIESLRSRVEVVEKMLERQR